jgi:pyridoxal 5-phosphate dependent beta-lyase
VSEPDATVGQPWHSWAASRPAFAGIHLDAAAAGRMSIAVHHAITDHLRRESKVGAYIAEDEAAAPVAAGRAALGSLLGIPTEGVAFVESATAALRSLLTAWPLPEPASVAVAPSEWGPNLRAFRMRGVDARTLPIDSNGLIDLDALPRQLATCPPSLVHVTHVAAHRGLIQPLDEIVTLCHAAGVPVWVDAAQALGHVDSVSNADAAFATSRKWLCGPRGVGVLGVAEQWWSRLQVEPLVLAPDRPVVARLESDEANIAARLGLCLAVQDYLLAGPAAVQHRLAFVGSLVRDALSTLTAWRLVPSPTSFGAIVALEPTERQDVTAERRRLLREHQILVTASQPARAPLEMTSPSLRISAHVDLTSVQLDALTRALSSSPLSRL